MNFTRLRLHGFKSFVEPTDLHIGPGMTGIVGPNGCGKSNLVEALRWVMGENSAKSLRGGEMDDVIFAGTAMRPSRNLAEVTLELDNSARTASAEFNSEETLHIMRQIERGNGSDYRVNGKPVRRRDVKLLFADQSTGSHSTNLVGQGQIDALIRAKPQDRRQILEEAAGTSGLQARRHEAELKLKAAEQNLTRVDDVLQTYDTQLRSLKTQVRQASRYRNLADHIRRTEAALLHLRWIEAGQNETAAKDAFQAAEARAAELLAVVTQGNAARTEIAAELPAMRQAEAAAAAIVQKLTLAREQIDSETRRIEAETREQQQRLEQTTADRAREIARSKDGETAIVKLLDEAALLAKTLAGIDEELPQITETLASLTSEVDALDVELARQMQETASAEARKNSLQRENDSLAERRTKLAERRAQMDSQRVALAAEAATRPDLALAEALVEATETELAKRQSLAQDAETFYREAEALQVQARDIAQNAKAEVTKLRAESDALTALLETHEDTGEQVIDLISVTPGLENALAIAVGEALTAALDPSSAKHWRDMGPMAEAPALPEGVASLAQFVKAPPALARCLSQIGLVENAEAGQDAVRNLRAGQIIVSRDGWAWRWDGFTLTPDAKTSTALRLQQRNRVAALEEMIATAVAEAERAETTLAESTAFLAQRQEEDLLARKNLSKAYAAVNDARSTYAKQEKESTEMTSKLAAMDDTLRQITADIVGLQSRASDIDDELKALPDLDAARLAINENRTRLAELRSKQAVSKSDSDRLTREKKAGLARSEIVAAETTAWQSRLSAAQQQITSLTSRMEEADARLKELRERPAELQAKRAALLTELSAAEAKRKDAADLLISTETKLGEVEQQLKRDENALGTAREERVRCEAAVQAAAEHFKTLRERMAEKLSCGPEDLPALAELKDGEPLPDLAELEQTLARYVRERDNMGPVNLRADSEAEAMQTQIDTLQKEKEDLVGGISKLRQGISQLNAEARDRLQNAFTCVNEHFQSLFKGLFNGGRAYLELIDGEDPMNAGLEIYASPPGKKMQALSLLSGGERTLTALALLFAVFQTHPSPICVLDEAEAALDESNIDRFCKLVSRISKETNARFLIITHQRVTMAHMDRLFGVTMSEKGVSQLVSVDLDAAIAIRDGSKAEEALRAVRAA
ncbi:MAG: chromosome segregation protein SMC [Alphaproteobacteria bacterium]|nr:chromosome segregation protein SMC [Alphaproteobacteria bacterium]